MIIGITGLARSGKDTAASMLQHYIASEYILGSAKIESFAKPIKETCRYLFDWNDDHLYGDLKEVVDPRWGVTPRHAMQTLGTDWARNMINDQFWVKRVLAQESKCDYLIVPDVRFENEAAAVRKRGILIHVNRDNRPGISTIGHESELGVEWLEGDSFISNNGSKKNLSKKVQKLVDKLADT